MANPRVDVVIGAKTEQFGAGVKGVVSQLNTIGRDFQIGPLGRLGELLVNPLTAAAAAASGLVGMIAKSVAYAERLEAIASRVGTTVSKAGAIARAEDITGAPAGTVERVVGKLREEIGGALTGSKSSQEAFGELGISMERLASASPVELLEAIISKFESGTSSAREYAAANKLLGRSFDDLLPFFERGLGREMAEPSFLDLTQQEVASNQRWGLRWRSLKNFVGRGVVKLGAGLGMGFEGLATHLGSGALLPSAILGSESAWEGISENQAQSMIRQGSYQAGDLRAAELRLHQAQQRRQLLDAMRSSNRLGLLGMEFEGLPVESRLGYLRDLQSAGVASLGRQSAFEQENTVTALLRVMEDIRKLQAEADEKLRSIDSSSSRTATTLEGL